MTHEAFKVVWEFLVIEDPRLATAPAPEADAIFCFGSRHWRVPERAATLFHAGIAPVVLVTGGIVGPDDRTEAERFRAELVARDVPPERIVSEPRSTHTGENVRFGLSALHAAGVEPRRLVLVSWPVQARRCLATFAHLAPEVAVLSAPALRRPGQQWRPNDRRIRFALGEIDRLERYAAEGFIAPQTWTAEVRDAAAALRSAHGPALRAIPAAGPSGEAEDLALLVVEG